MGPSGGIGLEGLVLLVGPSVRDLLALDFPPPFMDKADLMKSPGCLRARLIPLLGPCARDNEIAEIFLSLFPFLWALS